MKLFNKAKLTVAIFALIIFSGCGKSPESAAQEVCDCISKTTQSESVGKMAGNAAECQETANKYREKFTGSDLNTFTQKLTDCTLGSMLR